MDPVGDAWRGWQHGQGPTYRHISPITQIGFALWLGGWLAMDPEGECLVWLSAWPRPNIQVHGSWTCLCPGWPKSAKKARGRAF